MNKEKVYDVLNETERREQLRFDNLTKLLELKIKADEQKVERMKILFSSGVQLLTLGVAVTFCLLSVGTFCYYEINGVLPLNAITKAFIALSGKMFNFILK